MMSIQPSFEGSEISAKCLDTACIFNRCIHLEAVTDNPGIV